MALWKKILGVFGVVAFFAWMSSSSSPSNSERGSGASHTSIVTGSPDGNTAAVARAVIRENFEPSDCPSVSDARRLGDGSIKASCSNGDTYRVFALNGKTVAMKCSAAATLGVSGC